MLLLFAHPHLLLLPYPLTLQVMDRTGSAKYSRFPKDVIPMWIADMDFASPPVITHAVTRAAQRGLFGYSTNHSEVADSIARYTGRKQAWDVRKTDVTYLPAAVCALYLACVTIPQTKSVLTFTPIYPPFMEAPAKAGRKLITCDLVETPATSSNKNKPSTYTLDFELIERTMVEENVGCLLLCNPHNPVGRVWTKDELQGLADLCIKHDVLVCSDELWSDLIYDTDSTPHTCIGTLTKGSHTMTERTILLDAAGKTYNIPGLKMAYLVTPDRSLRRRVREAAAVYSHTNNTLGLLATQAGLEHGEPWRLELLHYLRSNKAYLHDRLESQGPLQLLSLRPAEATYLAWLDCTKLLRRLPSQQLPGHWFEMAARVGVSEGCTFGPSARPFVRLNYACPRTVLVEAVDRVEEALQQVESPTK